MATTITFVGGGDVYVKEDVEAVNDKLNAGGGLPVRLTEDDSSEDPVYVNPANITHWKERRSGGGVF